MALTAAKVKDAGADNPLPIGPFNTEIWRVTATGTPAAGDSIVLTPSRGRFVVSALGGPAVANIAASKANVSIVTRTALTLNDTFDILLLVQL